MNAMSRQGQMPAVQYSVTKLGGGVTGQGVAYPGGLDLETPSLSLQPGACRNMLNFECSQNGGYARIGGLERVDGRASPSGAGYTIVQVVSFTNTPNVGDALNQASSGATGIVAAIGPVGENYMVVTQVTGTFDAIGPITVGVGPLTITAANPLTVTGTVVVYAAATPVGTATTTTVMVSSQLDALYLAAAADVYRAMIGAVPGSGAVLGVVPFVFSGVNNLYAFRANTAGTAVNLYQTTPSGWSQIPLFNEVGFTAGNVATPLDGETLTQGAVTAVVKRVVTASGSFAGTAAGTFVVGNLSTGSFSAGAASLSGGATVTLSGSQTAITMLPGGKFEFDKGNFSGQLGTLRIYGCDGVNRGFEFDGVTLVPITTGVNPDQPKHVRVHKNHLFFSVQSSIFYSAPGAPFRWDSIDLGGEIATGDIVTGMLTMPGSQTTATMAVYGQTNTAFLYGTGSGDWNFVQFNTGSGGLDYSVQNLADSFVFDDLGIVSLKTTLNYGNFLPTTLTKNILPFIIQERTKIACSTVHRGKSEYRVFFSDGYGLWLTVVNGQYLGAGVVQFPVALSCASNGTLADGTEVTYAGAATGGYVYQLDVGTSFDGAAIDAFITMAWDPIKSPRILKRFRRASLEIQGSGYAAIAFGYQLGYGTTEISQPAAVPYTSGFMPAPAWDQFVWDNFFWDGATLLPTNVDVTGSAENIQVTISSTTNYIAPYTVNSIIHSYTPRRGLRS